MLDNKTLRKVQKLAKSQCCNCDSTGKCPISPIGECLYVTDNVQRCKWFEEAVLPNDPVLEAEYMKQLSEYLGIQNHVEGYKSDCKNCHSSFIAHAPNSRYCSDSCRQQAAKRSKRERMRRLRQKQREQ